MQELAHGEYSPTLISVDSITLSRSNTAQTTQLPWLNNPKQLGRNSRLCQSRILSGAAMALVIHYLTMSCEQLPTQITTRAGIWGREYPL